MTMRNAVLCRASALLLALSVLFPAQAQQTADTAPPAPAEESAPFEPVKVEHALGVTTIEHLPRRVAALDMNEVDFLDLLGVPIAGAVQDFVPHFLSKYKDDPAIADLGFIVQPNIESVYRLQPDLILITALHAEHYRELSRIAPTIHFDVDYRNSETGHIDVVKEHLLTLGRIFGREAAAADIAARLDARIAEARRVTDGRPEKALIVLHNNGAFSAFGIRSRYGFVFDALGVAPANPAADTGLHGQPISNEFIQETNPDIIYIIDRTAVMERRPVLDAESVGNPLLRQTNAWKNGRVVFADPEAWYVTGASPTALGLIIDDVLRGYGR